MHHSQQEWHWRQNHLDALGAFLRPVHLKWNQTRQDSHTTEFSSSSFIVLVHLPQYHTVLFFTASTTCNNAFQPSLVKYFWIFLIQTLSSKHDAETHSGLASTSSSSISFPFSADSATLASTNHFNITIMASVGNYPLHSMNVLRTFVPVSRQLF